MYVYTCTTYNGKLSEGRGNFVCISTVLFTVLDLYFLWDWIGPFSRGSNHTYMTCSVLLCMDVMVRTRYNSNYFWEYEHTYMSTEGSSPK